MGRPKIKKRDETVLLTGATGFTGANLAIRLVKEGYDVHAITRKTSDKWRLSTVLNQIVDHVVDLRENDKLKETINKINPDIVFHLATAGVYGGKHLPDRDVIDVNFIGTFNLINACKEVDYRCFINTGSSAEYGPKNHPMKETDICEPINMYGITKVASTLYSNVVAKNENKPIINFRLFSPFGPFDDASRLMTYAITNAIRGKNLELANPDATRDYIYVGDVVDYYLGAIEKVDKLKGETFNIGSGQEKKISFVIEKIIEFTDSNSKVLWNRVEPRKIDAPFWEADMSKTDQQLDYVRREKFEAALKKTIDWFRDNLSFYAPY